MRFKSSLSAVGLVVAAVAAVSRPSLAQSPIDKIYKTGADTKFIAIGTLTPPGSTPAPSIALKEEQATLRLFLNGNVEQFWLREDGKCVVFLMAGVTREEAVGLLRARRALRAD